MRSLQARYTPLLAPASRLAPLAPRPSPLAPRPSPRARHAGRAPRAAGAAPRATGIARYDSGCARGWKPPGATGCGPASRRRGGCASIAAGARAARPCRPRPRAPPVRHCACASPCAERCASRASSSRAISATVG
ncbi:hypothetical protein SZ29_02460 [Burkholderia pseudomallei]|nr:hypothetical protein SZ29_02460 [Burkholderia pseudomallei]